MSGKQRKDYILIVFYTSRFGTIQLYCLACSSFFLHVLFFQILQRIDLKNVFSKNIYSKNAKFSKRFQKVSKICQSFKTARKKGEEAQKVFEFSLNPKNNSTMFEHG